MQQQGNKKSNKITLELLRRRSEHNDGDVSTLKEVTLHQFDIEKIENLDIYCRGLEILFLQNNQICKIENLHKLKSLKYLQLALNNITVLENLEQCECLTKLDLTVNFIEDVLGVETLVNNIFLKELYLIGNPCAKVEGYREFIVVTLPQLHSLDGKEITKSERILAMQKYAEIRATLVQDRQERLLKGDPNADVSALLNDGPPKLLTPEEIEQKRRDYKDKAVPHTPAARLQAARDLALLNEPTPAPSKNDPLKQAQADSPNKPPPILLEEGRVLQKNAGKWEYTFSTTPELVILDVQISKFIDTSLIDVDVHPTWIRVTIKGKLLQLMLPKNVAAEQVVCERSQYTGGLRVSMLREAQEGDVIDLAARVKQRIGTVVPNSKTKGSAKVASMASRYARLGLDDEGCVSLGSKKPCMDIRNVVALPKLMDDFVDNPDVPPLC